jgi:hypothetical protein
MEAATPNKPKKYEVVEYPEQKVDNLEEKIQKSQSLFETLSMEDQGKYNQSYAEFVQKAKALGFDQVESYDIFIVDKEEINGAQAGFTTTTKGNNYVELSWQYITKKPKNAIIKAMFHELVGHCLSSKNSRKVSENLEVRTVGLAFTRFELSKYYEVTRKSFKDIQEKLAEQHAANTISKILKMPQTSLLPLLSDEDIAIINAARIVLKMPDEDDLFHLARTMSSNYERYKKDIEDELNGKRKAGLILSEGVTDYLAINMTTDDEDERFELIEDSSYAKYVLPIVDMGSHLLELNPANLQAWDDCLYDARLTGQPYKIIKFLKDKTGVSITPKELFSLDFSKILGIKEENKLDIAN